MTKVTNAPHSVQTKVPMETERPKKPLNPMESILVGSVAGLVEVSVNQPLVTLKNEMQRNTFSAKNLSVRNLWSGWSANASGVAGVTAVQVVVKEFFDNTLSDGGNKRLTEWQKLLNAVAAGVVAAPVACSSEMVMMRHQANVKAYLNSAKVADAKPPTYTSTSKQLLAQYGAAGFTRGLVGTAVRDGGFVAAYAYGALFFKEKFKPYTPNEMLATLSGGVTAGLVGSFATHPFDTWKTQRQSDVTTHFWRGSLQDSFNEAYRGFTPRATRVALAVTLMTGIVQEFGAFVQNSKRT